MPAYKINLLSGRDLNAAVMLAMGLEVVRRDDGLRVMVIDTEDDMEFECSIVPDPYCTNWEWAGPVLHRERISLNYSDPEEEDELYAWAICGNHEFDDASPLVAGTRAFVARKVGRIENYEYVVDLP